MFFPVTETAVLLLIDMQEKLLKAMNSSEQCLARQKIMLEAANILGLDTIITEQYPQGLGHTVPELSGLLKPEWPVIEKKSFSCFGEPLFCSRLKSKSRTTIAIMGIESHVCVFQTVIDALEQGYLPFVLEDTLSSRNSSDMTTAMRLLRHHGAIITTVESYLFMLMKSADHPSFRQIAKLIK
jgi:nicotinamidase-related amidase